MEQDTQYKVDYSRWYTDEDYYDVVESLLNGINPEDSESRKVVQCDGWQLVTSCLPLEILLEPSHQDHYINEIFDSLKRSQGELKPRRIFECLNIGKHYVAVLREYGQPNEEQKTYAKAIYSLAQQTTTLDIQHLGEDNIEKLKIINGQPTKAWYVCSRTKDPLGENSILHQCLNKAHKEKVTLIDVTPILQPDSTSCGPLSINTGLYFLEKGELVKPEDESYEARREYVREIRREHFVKAGKSFRERQQAVAWDTTALSLFNNPSEFFKLGAQQLTHDRILKSAFDIKQAKLLVNEQNNKPLHEELISHKECVIDAVIAKADERGADWLNNLLQDPNFKNFIDIKTGWGISRLFISGRTKAQERLEKKLEALRNSSHATDTDSQTFDNK